MAKLLINKNKTLEKQEEILAYFFILPFTIGFVVLKLIPFISSFVISVTDLTFITLLSKAKFIGLYHFINMWKDKDVTHSIIVTLYYMILFVPTIMISSLLLAIFVNSKMYLNNIIKTSLFMPFISNFAAIAVVWTFILDVNDGVVNMLLKNMGFSSQPMWLFGTKTVIPTVVMIVSWTLLGFYMVIYIAALKNVPEELYESALIDGAGKIQRIWHITLPMISPTIFFLFIASMTNAFKTFTVIQTLTEGGPARASYVMAKNIYATAFVDYNMSYATAQSIVMMMMMLTITILSWYGQKKWVNY